MSSEWISRRKREWSEAKKEVERQRRLDSEASTASDSLFDQLKRQVKQDVADYNVEFPDCPASFSEHGQTFEIHCRKRNVSLSVSKEVEERIITYRITRVNNRTLEDASDTGHLSIRANYDTGSIDFCVQNRPFPDVSDVSEFLLDSILCGPRDYTRELKTRPTPSD